MKHYADSKYVTAVLNEVQDFLDIQTGYGVQNADEVLTSLECEFALYARDKARVFKMREKIAEAGWMCYEREFDELMEEWN